MRFFLALDGRAISMVVLCVLRRNYERKRSDKCRANGAPAERNAASDYMAGSYLIAKVYKQPEKVSVCGTARSHERRGRTLPAPRMHFEMGVALEDVLDRHKRATRS